LVHPKNTAYETDDAIELAKGLQAALDKDGKHEKLTQRLSNF
jgi:hypothetical protein